MKNFKNKFFKVFTYFVLPILFFFIVLVSFFLFKKLVLPYDLILKKGMKESEVALKIRQNLINNRGLTPVSFLSKDGVKLAGLFLKRNNAIGNIVLAHGYQSCKEFVSCFIDMLPEYNILLFDFRAHGKSFGRFRTIGCHEYKDLFAAVDYLKKITKPSKAFLKTLPLYIIGLSMGGSVAIDALAKRPNLCDGLIVDSPFANLKDVIYNAFRIKTGFPPYPFAFFAIRILNFVTNSDVSKVCPLNSVKKIDKPIFFIHSCVDEVVDPRHTLNMYANSKSLRSKLWIGPVCKHGYLRRRFPKLYKKKINRFLKEL